MPRHTLLVLLLFSAATALGKSPRAVVPRTMALRAPVSARLRTLAKRAKRRHEWKSLRRYAASASTAEARGLAYFTLGYREYMAGEDALAADDLKLSASTECSLKDFAAYHEGLADAQLNRFREGIAALTSFTDRYPGSIYRLRAANLLASLLIKASDPRQALEVLKEEPAARTHVSSLLLVAQADEALPDDIAASRAYQEVYDVFPATPESRVAATALDRLRRRMGSSYPESSLEAQTGRAGRLYDRELYQEALSAYDSLLHGHPQAKLRDEWRMGRARCFIRMRQYSDAINALAQQESNNPEMDARRLALMTRTYELNGDEPALLKTLDEIYSKYPLSPSYANALAYTGGYYAREGSWRTAARYYLPLSQDFPKGRYSMEATWRVAWYDVLSGNWEAAQAALAGFLRHYPDSTRAKAALYWLAQVKLQQGDLGAAAEMDHFVATRYTNTYYGLKARQKLENARRDVRPKTATNPVGATLANLGIHIPPRPTPPLPPCGEISPDKSLQPYLTLDALSLHSLGEQYLKDVIALHPKDPRLSLAVARVRHSGDDVSSAIFDAGRGVPDYDEYAFTALPEEVWKMLYPRPYWKLVRRYSRANRLDPYLVMGLIRQESAFNPHATSTTHARGLMQMEPYTATDHVRGRRRRRRVVRDLYNPAFNIRISTRHLRGILASFNGNLPETLASYNAGDTRVRQWIANSKVQDPDQFLETIPFTDTRAYVELVLRDSMIYQSILTGKAKFRRCPRER